MKSKIIQTTKRIIKNAVQERHEQVFMQKYDKKKIHLNNEKHY